MYNSMRDQAGCHQSRVIKEKGITFPKLYRTLKRMQTAHHRKLLDTEKKAVVLALAVKLGQPLLKFLSSICECSRWETVASFLSQFSFVFEETGNRIPFLVLFVMGILLLASCIRPDESVDIFTRLSSQISAAVHSWLSDYKDQTIALMEYLPVFPSNRLVGTSHQQAL